MSTCLHHDGEERLLGKRLRMLQLCAVDFTVANILRPIIDACQTVYDVEIACAPGAESHRLEGQGYKFQYIPFQRGLNLFAHLRALFHLIRLFRRERYDIIHTHTPVAAVVARLAARISGIPVVVNTVHGFYFQEHSHPLIRWAGQLIERWAGRFTTFSIFVSKEDYSTALRIGVCTPDTGRWIPNGVDQERFDPERDDLAEAAGLFRAKIGADRTDVLIGIVARLVREKGINELLNAFALIQRAHPEARLVLVGDALESDRDGVRAELERSVRNSEYGARIHWVGYRRDVEIILATLDIFVLPSYREGMPLSILEAMSMALPVVATDIRGCREEVVHGETGLLVPRQDERALAGALEQMLVDPDVRHRMGETGLTRVREMYDERASLTTLLDIFRRLSIGRDRLSS